VTIGLLPYAQAAALPPPGAPFVETVNRTIDAHVVVEGGVQGAHFVNCTWRHLGGAGLHFVGGSRHSSVRRSTFHDVSAAAVMVGSIVDWAEPDPKKQTFNNTVADCHIYDCLGGRGRLSALSVFLFKSVL
jgi:hypothetical protein